MATTVPRSDQAALAAQVAASRGDAFDFLAEQVLSAPVRPDQSRETLLERWLHAAEALDHPASRVEAALDTAFSDEELSREFSDLFIVPAGRYLAPMESVYAGAATGSDVAARGRLRGPAWWKVRSAYQRSGYDVPATSRHEADHLGCELRFLAALCREESAAWAATAFADAGRYRREQLEFLNAHPRTWIGKLCHRCDQVAALPYYREVLRFIAGHLDRESGYLAGESVEESGPVRPAGEAKCSGG